MPTGTFEKGIIKRRYCSNMVQKVNNNLLENLATTGSDVN